jgi:hypothetical protein
VLSKKKKNSHVGELTHTGHWLFQPSIQRVMQYKTIPLYICNTHKLTDKSLQVYEKATGRPIPMVHCNSTPKPGKILLNVVKCACPKQISVHPRHLTPWEPVIGGEVVVIMGAWLEIDEQHTWIWILTSETRWSVRVQWGVSSK